MAVMEIYRSLSEDQKQRIQECKSVAEILTVAKSENIHFSDDDLEALYNDIYIEKKYDILKSGIYGFYIKPTEALMDLICEARENEKQIQLKYPGSEEMDLLVLRLMSRDNETFQDILNESGDMSSFFDSCMRLRTPFWEAKQRKLLREQVRLVEFINEGGKLPNSSDDFLSLWDAAYNMEPRWNDELPAHFRTENDCTPFANLKNRFEEKPVIHGYETASPEEIPDAVSELLKWIHRSDCEKEILAAASHYLFTKIHPFSDGNGHTARFLCCAMLSPDYSPATLVTLLEQFHKNRSIICDYSKFASIFEGNMNPGIYTMLQFIILGQRHILSL